MSQENVELVEGLMPTDTDFTLVFRDDRSWAVAAEVLATCHDPDFECVVLGGPDGEARYVGLDGLRKSFLNWYAAWETYRHEIERIVDLDDRVLVLKHDSARLPSSQQEVTLSPALVLTFRNGKISRWEAFFDQADALKAVGLAE